MVVGTAAKWEVKLVGKWVFSTDKLWADLKGLQKVDSMGLQRVLWMEMRLAGWTVGHWE